MNVIVPAICCKVLIATGVAVRSASGVMGVWEVQAPPTPWAEVESTLSGRSTS